MLYNSIKGNYFCDMHLYLAFRTQCNNCGQKNIFSSSYDLRVDHVVATLCC